MISTTQQVINQVVIGILALIVLGGSLVLLIIGRDVPGWWQNFDGMVVVAAFANSAFFVQARTSLPTANALATSQQHIHDLALAGIQMSKSSPSGSTAPVSTGQVTS